VSTSAVLIGLGLGVLAVVAPHWWALIRHGEDRMTWTDVLGMIVGPWLVALGLVLLVVEAWSG
jgi:hypothetical protein